MAETLTFKPHVRERDDVARLGFRLSVTTSANDTLPFALDITEHDFLAESFQQPGVMVDIDHGDGVLAPLTASEMPGTITLTESLDGFGAQTLTFGKIGPGQSPIQSGFLRGAGRVRMSGVLGTLGGYREYPMFDGFFRDSSYEPFPSASAIVAQDDSLLNEPLFYLLAAKSLRSRRSIITEICELYRIRPGTFTFNDPENVGGYVLKEINEAGGKTVAAFLAEFITPTGCRIYRRDGTLNIRRFSTDDDPVRTLTFSDLRKAPAIDPQASNAANAVRVASEIYPYTGPLLDGSQPPVTTDVVNAVYQPVVATHKQDHTTGVISALALSSSNILREVSKVVTTQTYSAGSLVSEMVETYGWYAAKAANLRQNADGSTRYNDSFDVFKFPDLSWRYVQEETYGVITRMSRQFNYDPATHLFAYESSTWYTYFDAWEPLGQRNGTNTATVWVADVFMRDDGTGWKHGRERIDFLFTRVTRQEIWDSATKGKIANTWNVLWSSTYYNTTVIAANVYVFAGPIYAHRVLGSDTIYQSWKDTVTALTPTTHRSVLALTFQHSTIVQYTTWPRPLVAHDQTVNAPLPKVTYDIPYQVQEPASVTAVDRVGVALLGRQITASTENAWCENTDEMGVAAFDVLRFDRAIPVRIEMNLDFGIRAGDVIALPPHPDFAHEEAKVLAWTCTWTLDPSAADMGTLAIDGLYVPPELR